MGTRVGNGVSGGHYLDANRADAPMSPGFLPLGVRCAGLGPPGSKLVVVLRAV
jgi:hypothetical protein